MIRLQNVNKYFNRKKSNEIHVINNTSLELPESGIVTLLGPSGCGKTTLLNAIGGLDKVHSGKIYIDEECITGRRSGKVDALRNAKIGYIFQNFNLLDKMTVFENVAVALRMIGIKDKKVIKERVEYCLKAVGIYPFRNRTTDALSGGQRQRVAIARAIVKNPRIIIADEPTGNLDSANTIEVMNIIKTISRDRLVLLVTHEKKIAEFYSSRIIEMKDGCVVSDRENDAERYLDYQLENKIYLQDLKVHKTFAEEAMQIDVYGNEEPSAGIKLVFRGGNLYINTGGRFNVIDENTNIEMIDEHYTAMDASIYEDNAFRYDKGLPEGYKAKYTSLYTPFNMIGRGFRTVAGFKFLKKLLLVGFVFASMFAFLATSNILGVLDVKEKDFLTTNSQYVTVANPGKSVEQIEQVAAMKSAKYVLPGNTQVRLSLPLDDYYQTAGAAVSFSASLTRLDTIKEKKPVCGRMPTNSREIVLDKMTVQKILDAKLAQTIGIHTQKQFIGRKIKVPNLEAYTIVGIADTNSPSFFVAEEECMRILTNAEQGDTKKKPEEASAMEPGEAPEEGRVADYALSPASIKIKKGRAPSSDYEVVVSETHAEEFTLNKAINKKVNGKKLTLVGFYSTDTPADDDYYVTENTLRLNYIGKQKEISVYTEDTAAAVAELQGADFSAQANYERDLESYRNNLAKTTRSSLIAAGIIMLVALIEMFLMLRSSFLSRIKEVGTMRAIGLKKRDVYRMFMGEIIVITFLTAIPGIALMYYIVGNVVKITPYLAGMYMVTPPVAGLTFALILLFNMIAGLIPVFRTMRKTPAAILSRTDI